MNERQYPLTYPGYYDDTLDVCPTVSSERCVLDVTAYRGRVLGVHAVPPADGCCALADETGAVLCRWSDARAELTVPADARRLYLSNDHTVNPDFYITVPQDAVKRPNGLLFYADFTNAAALDPNDFASLALTGDCCEDGLVLPVGMEHAVVIHKSIAADNWTLTAEVTSVDHAEEIFLGTRVTQTKACRHAAMCSVNFAEGTLCLYRGSDGASVPTEAVQCAGLSELLAENSGHRDYILRLERVNVAIRAELIHRATGKSVSVFQGLIPEETETTIAGGCLAGKMYDSPQLFVTAGRPVIRRMYAAAKTTPKVMFFGDSVTQGAHNLPQDAWAQMSAEYFGNSMCCGRGSGDVWGCLNQVRSMVPVCRPKVMVITIGTNNAPDTPASLYEKFIHMAEYWGVIPIINCVPACDKRAQCRIMNGHIRKLSALKSRFDLATRHSNAEDGTQNLAYYAADATHLNTQGNRLLYERFISDFAWLKNL